MNGLCKQLLLPEDCKKNAILSKMATFVLAIRVTERLEIAQKHVSWDPQNGEENEHATSIVISKGFCDFDITLLTNLEVLTQGFLVGIEQCCC